MSTPEPLTFTRVPSDANGNPRYAVHFLNLNTRAELDRAGDDCLTPQSEN